MYQYERNRNMTQRLEAGVAYTQTWDVDNRLTSVAKGNSTTQYYYDADGTLVRKVEPRGQTVYASADYEVFYPAVVTVTIPSTFTHKLYMPFVAIAQTNGPCHDTCTYYRFNGQQVAIRTSGTVFWLHGDHLGSAIATTDINGTKVSELRYKPYGETRYSSGNTPTDKRFTSQEQQGDIGLYLFGARFFDPQIGRFISADTIVPRPGNPQSFNRYSYVVHNPLVRIDPSGHGDCNVQTTLGCKPWWIADQEIRQTFPSEMKRSLILETGIDLKNDTTLGSLEKFARLTEYSAELYSANDTKGFMLDTSYVILGWSRSQGMYNVPSTKGSDWLGQDVFKDWGGWSTAYIDKESVPGGKNNQMYHFWFYVAVTYFDGPMIALAGNAWHETPVNDSAITDFLHLPTNNGVGTSQQDRDLGVRGVELGNRLTQYQYLSPALPPSKVGEWLRTNLAETK